MQRSIDMLEREIISYFEREMISHGRLDPEKLDYSYVLPQVVYDQSADKNIDYQREIAMQLFRWMLYLTVTRNRGMINDIVCDELKYCEARDDEKIKIVSDTLGSFLSTSLGFLVPRATLSEYVVRRQWLEPICQCRD